MAEHVQAALDQMVAPLLDLQERNIFTADEVHAVLTRRRESEYALRRRHARKSDYVEYLQHEIRLEQLRALRTKRLYPRRQQQLVEDGGSGALNKKNPGDTHIRQHLHLLWTRTLRKFGSDLALWLQYAQFCKEHGSHRKLSGLYAHAVQLHPRATGLWVEAADFEWQQGQVPAARVLLQRGLRINPQSTELWLQSFALELHAVQKLEARRKVLQGSAAGEATSDRDNSGTKPESDSKDAEDATTADGEVQQSSTPDDLYALARIVFDHACQSVPDQVGFHVAFLQQCRFFPDTTSLERHILQTIKERNGNASADAWMAQAMWLREQQRRQETPVGGAGFLLQSQKHKNVEESLEPAPKRARSESSGIDEETFRDPVLQILRNATLTLRTEDMYLKAVRFLFQYRDEDDDDSEDSERESDNAGRDECATLLQILWKEAQELDLVTPTLLLEYVDYLEGGVEEDADTAERILTAYIRSKGQSVPASVWMRLASLQSSSKGGSEALKTLETGLERTPVHQADHMTLLLQIVGLRLELNATPEVLWQLMEQILLLYPGFADMSDLEDPPFGIQSVPQACLEILRRERQVNGLEGSRKVYEKLLFRSGFARTIVGNDSADLEGLVDEAIDSESNCALASERKHRLLRIYDFAVRHVSSKNALEQYRKARDNVLYGNTSRLEDSIFSASVPKVTTFDLLSPDWSPEAIQLAYDVYQVVHLRNATMSSAKNLLSWKTVGTLYEGLDQRDQESWCVETKANGAVTPTDFLAPVTSKQCRAYCSFLVQKDKTAFRSVLEKLPITGFEWAKWSYEPALWIFFGRNESGPDMEGRPEHTDSVSHDGTWHFQLSGRKRWLLRPSCEMLNHLVQRLPHRLTEQWTEMSRLDVECREGDVIIINTKLWFHQTKIPTQRIPSVSYARDFRFEPDQMGAPTLSGGLTNVDGLYATVPIEEGTIVFTENDMPNAELHRSSSDPNCRVVVLDDGTNAVVSARSIGSGEFFCIPPSDEDCGDSDCEDDADSSDGFEQNE